jgi:glycosyltransferase involved in cell wall biosynthesis
MNILVLANKVPYPPRDGGALATLNMIKGLSHQGQNIHVLAMSTSKHPYTSGDIPAEYQKIASFHIVPVDTRISIVDLLRNLFLSRIPYNLERFFNSSFRKEIEIILKKNEFQIIQLEGLSLSSYIPFIRKLSSAKIVMRAHNVETRIWQRNAKQMRFGLRKIYFCILASRMKTFEQENLQQYDAIVPISNADEKEFLELGNRKPAFVAPFGVDPSFFQEKNGFSENPSIFFIGSLDWIPNQQGLTWFLSEVWDKLRIKHPDLTFHVAGRNAPASIQKLIKQKGVLFLGEVDNARDFINSNSMMVVPLFSGSGMRVKIIEAMALERTVITTTIGAEGIDGKNGKHLIIADSPDHFIEEISRIITHPEILPQIGSKAREFVKENFDNLVISQKLSGFYNSILT